MLVIIFAIWKWEHHIKNQHFIIRTDHQSLMYLIEKKLTTTSQQAWVAKLMQFDYEIRYKKGKENVGTDALSRSSSVELNYLTTVIILEFMAKIRVGWQEDQYL